MIQYQSLLLISTLDSLQRTVLATLTMLPCFDFLSFFKQFLGLETVFDSFLM